MGLYPHACISVDSAARLLHTTHTTAHRASLADYGHFPFAHYVTTAAHFATTRGCLLRTRAFQQVLPLPRDISLRFCLYRGFLPPRLSTHYTPQVLSLLPLSGSPIYLNCCAWRLVLITLGWMQHARIFLAPLSGTRTTYTHSRISFQYAARPARKILPPSAISFSAAAI